MSIHKRKMKTYHPRKKLHEKLTQKQELGDLEHKITMDFGNFLVLIEEGTTEQAAAAKQKTKSDLLKYGPDMQKLANEIGGKFPTVVHDFLDSIDSAIHTSSNMVDPDKVMKCYHVTQELEREIHAA